MGQAGGDAEPSPPPPPTRVPQGARRRRHRRHARRVRPLRPGRALPARPGTVPWGTLASNLAGSFLLGLLLALVLERFPPTRYVRPFLATGVLGALTTMSTFQVELALLIDGGHAGTALAYGAGSLAAGLVLARAGLVAGRLVPLRHPEAPR